MWSNFAYGAEDQIEHLRAEINRLTEAVFTLGNRLESLKATSFPRTGNYYLCHAVEYLNWRTIRYAELKPDIFTSNGIMAQICLQAVLLVGFHIRMTFGSDDGLFHGLMLSYFILNLAESIFEHLHSWIRNFLTKPGSLKLKDDWWRRGFIWVSKWYKFLNTRN